MRSIDINLQRARITGESTYEFIVDWRSLLKGSLKDLFTVMPALVAIHEVSINTMSRSFFVKQMPLSERAMCYTNGTDLYVTDYVTGRCFKCNLLGDEGTSWQEIELNNVLQSEIRDSLRIDKPMYDHVLPILRQLGKSRPRFCAASLSSDAVLMSVNLTFPYVEETGDTALANYFAILDVNADNHVDYWLVNPDPYMHWAGHSLDVEESFAVLQNDILLVPLFKSDDDEKVAHLLAKVRVVEGKCRFEEFVDFNRPMLYDSLGYAHNYANVSVNPQCAFMRSYPQLYLVNQDATLDLRQTFEERYGTRYAYKKFPFYFLDWQVLPHGYCVALFGFNGRVHQAVVDTRAREILYSKPLMSDKIDWPSARSVNGTGIVALSADHKAVVRYRSSR